MRGAGLSFPRAAPSASLGNLYGMPIHGKAVIIFGHAQPLADETSTVYTDNLLHLLHVSPQTTDRDPLGGAAAVFRSLPINGHGQEKNVGSIFPSYLSLISCCIRLVQIQKGASYQYLGFPLGGASKTR